MMRRRARIALARHRRHVAALVRRGEWALGELGDASEVAYARAAHARSQTSSLPSKPVAHAVRRAPRARRSRPARSARTQPSSDDGPPRAVVQFSIDDDGDVFANAVDVIAELVASVEVTS